MRQDDTINQMETLVSGMEGKQLQYQDLIADNGLDSGLGRRRCLLHR